MVILLLTRAASATFSDSEPANIITSNAVSVWIALYGVIAAVVSNTSILAMFVERAAKEREAQLALTAQRQATDILASKIAELDRQRSAYTMASTLSHELSQPLTSIQLYLDIWRANPQHTELQTILQGVDESTQLATGILQRMRD
jgi:signal transduction histidine kinase